MATSSFEKHFVLDSKKAVDSFEKILKSPTKSVKIDRTLTATSKESAGEQKLKRILSR